VDTLKGQCKSKQCASTERAEIVAAKPFAESSPPTDAAVQKDATVRKD